MGSGLLLIKMLLAALNYTYFWLKKILNKQNEIKGQINRYISHNDSNHVILQDKNKD